MTDPLGPLKQALFVTEPLSERGFARLPEVTDPLQLEGSLGCGK